MLQSCVIDCLMRHTYKNSQTVIFNEKKHIFGSNLFKNKKISKILKTDADLKYLAKFVEKLIF
jgi:hypothetical protein